MIPQDQLQKITSLSDIENRQKMMRGKLHKPQQKFSLTKRERQFAHWNETTVRDKYRGPQGYKWKGTPKKGDRSQ